MMNQEEKICRQYKTKVRCFQMIPYRFEFDGRINDKSCSQTFPPGYSIYVEEFNLDDPGPDNFVLVDGRALGYSAKLKWEDRERPLWKKLPRSNPLNRKSNRRPNIPCVTKLKVSKN